MVIYLQGMTIILDQNSTKSIIRADKRTAHTLQGAKQSLCGCGCQVECEPAYKQVGMRLMVLRLRGGNGKQIDSHFTFLVYI